MLLKPLRLWIVDHTSEKDRIAGIPYQEYERTINHELSPLIFRGTARSDEPKDDGRGRGDRAFFIEIKATSVEHVTHHEVLRTHQFEVSFGMAER